MILTPIFIAFLVTHVGLIVFGLAAPRAGSPACRP